MGDLIGGPFGVIIGLWIGIHLLVCAILILPASVML